MSFEYVCSDKTKVYLCKEKIRFCLDQSSIELSEKEKKIIAEYWDFQVVNNPSLFDGIVLSVKTIERLPGEILIRLEKTNYSHLTYIMNHINENITRCRSVAIGGYLLTSDGYWVLGKMSNDTSFPGVIQCIGGGLAEQDIFDGNPVHAFLRECEEEIGIFSDDIEIIDNDKYLYIRDKQTTLGICYVAKLNLTKEKLIDKFEKSVKDGEINELICFSENPIEMMTLLNNEFLVDYIKVLLNKKIKGELLESIFKFDFE